MLKPRALAPGARLAVVAPASPFDRDEFLSGIEEIRQMGFVPVYDDSVFARRGYVAGTPEERASALNAALSPFDALAARSDSSSASCRSESPVPTKAIMAW